MSKYFGNFPAHSFESGYVLSFEARVAIDIIKHCALTVATVDGEDSAGRRALKLLPAEKVAARAVEIAQQLTNHFEDREWIESVDLSPPQAAEIIGAFQRATAKYGYGLDNNDEGAIERLKRLTEEAE